MKTYNGQTITKKQISAVLRTLDATAIFRLYHHIYGGKVDRHDVMLFMREYAPTKRVERAAYHLCYMNSKHNTDRMIWAPDCNIFPKHRVVEEMRRNLAMVGSPYAKRPTMGHTHLYFCSPVYGHLDYNKWRALPIAGNEAFCSALVALANKHF